jgi:queuosine precursor transporter
MNEKNRVKTDMTMKLSILLSVFTGLLIGMNLLGSKIIGLFGISVSVGIFMVPFTFLITDIVSEVYGRRMAQKFLIAGIVTLFIILVYTAIFVVLEPHARYEANDEYRIVFGASLRILIASIVAFAISQFHDIWAFEFWKAKTKGKALWLRNNASTMVSQAADTLIFMFIAFYMITPKFDAMFIIELAIPFYLFKVAFAMLDTPLVYAGVRWLKDKPD